MAYDFDRVIDRSGTDATKLQKYAGTDIAVLDRRYGFCGARFHPRATAQRRLDHPIVGYTKDPTPSPWLCKTGSYIITAGRRLRTGSCGYQAWYRG